MRVVLALLVMCGCANVHVNRAALITSTAALAADWHFTRAAAGREWHCGRLRYEERGMAGLVTGPRPTPSTVDVYFAFSAIANAALWLVVPERFRIAAPVAFAAASAKGLGDTLSSGISDCSM